MDVPGNQHRTHRDGTGGKALGGGDQVGSNSKALRRKCATDATKGGNDFIEDQQDAVLAAYLTQALEVALGRHHHAAGTGDGRSEEHTSELQSLMRTSYAVFCLKKKTSH